MISKGTPRMRTSRPSGSIFGNSTSTTSVPTNATRRPSSTSVVLMNRPWPTVTPLAGS
jgi:hypothetical protein